MLKFGFMFVNLFILYFLYEIPKAKIELFFPKGFQVSIPADDADRLFAFHGKLNEELDDLEPGTWSKDILKERNGRFTFKDRNTPIKLGDTIYYWTYVEHDGIGYREDDGVYKVTKYSNSEGQIENGLQSQNSSKNKWTTPGKSFVNDVNSACPGDLLFEDDFSGSSLDLNKWRMERRMAEQPDFEFNTYLNDPQSLSLSDGLAVLKPIKFDDVYGEQAITKGLDLTLDCTGDLSKIECNRTADTVWIVPPYITPQFSTINTFKFKYGKVEIRAKLPSANWVFPQIFLNPVDHKYGNFEYRSGQLRVVQSSGDCEISSGAILSDKEPLRSAKMCSQMCRNGGDWHNQFHTYSMTWLPDSITFSVDGRDICSIQAGQALYRTVVEGVELSNRESLEKNGETPLAPFDKNFYLVLGYGVGGINDFDEKETKPWTNEDPRAMTKFWKSTKAYIGQGDKYKFTIDYIRVYAV